MNFVYSTVKLFHLILKAHFVHSVGSGVFCNRQFHAGDFLLEYRGELITMEEGVEREKSNLTRKGNFLYFFDYGNTRKW